MISFKIYCHEYPCTTHSKNTKNVFAHDQNSNRGVHRWWSFECRRNIETYISVYTSRNHNTRFRFIMLAVNTRIAFNRNYCNTPVYICGVPLFSMNVLGSAIPHSVFSAVNVFITGSCCFFIRYVLFPIVNPLNGTSKKKKQNSTRFALAV